MHTISVKELRQKFPFVKSELKKGTTFLIIHKSVPIGKLSPVDASKLFEEASEEEIENAARADFDDDDFLTKEELQYYLSLK